MINDYDRGKLKFEFVVTQSLFQHGFLVGTPGYVSQKLKKLINDYKLTDLLCWTRLGGLDQEKVMKSMKLFVEKVLPDVV